MGKMTVFHGSYMAVEKPEIRKYEYLYRPFKYLS